MNTEYTTQDIQSEKPSPIGVAKPLLVNPGILLQQHLLGHKHGVTFVVCTGILHSVTSFLLTLMFGEFFMLQFNTGSNKGKLLEWLGIRINNLDQFFGLLVGLLAMKLVTQYLEKYLILLQGEFFAKDAREKLFISQVNSPQEVFGLHSYGNYLLRYSNDMKSVQQYLTKGVLAGSRDAIFVLVGMAFFFLLNSTIGLVVTGYLLAAALTVVVLANRQQNSIRNSRNKRSNLLAFVTRSFQRFPSVKEKKQEGKTSEKFLERSKELFIANRRNAQWESGLESAVSILHLGLIILLLGLIATGVISVNASDGLSCILLLLLLQGTVKRLFKVPSVLKKGSISLEKITSVINAGQR